MTQKLLMKLKKLEKEWKIQFQNIFIELGLEDPTLNFEWEYILIDRKKVRNAWCMPGGKIAVYTGILEATKNTEMV